MENGLFVTEVKGDGYCFPKSVLKCLFLDHKYVMSFARFKSKITEHLIANFQKYTDYHTDSPDQLVYEATEFFNDRNFTTDVVDILVHATADALQLRMKIFRRSPAGNIQCEIIQAENPLMDIMLEGKKNWWHFEYRNGTRVCYSCGVYANQVPCGARKMIEFCYGSERAHVYHIRTHNCKLQPETNDDVDFTRQWVRKYPGLSYKQLKSTVIQFLIESGDNESAERAAYRITNRTYRKNRREQGITVDDVYVSTQSIEAVVEAKKGSDQLDKFHIYKINNGNMNDMPDFVVKSSSAILKMALDMDQEAEPNVLQEEDAFFYGSHSRCTGYISLGLLVHHTSMRKVFRLVSMEVKSESTENLVLFWKMVNEMLQKVGKKGDQYKFNPKFLMTDEAGAHFAALRIVYGDEWVKKKCITCQWHFLNSVNEKNTSHR